MPAIAGLPRLASARDGRRAVQQRRRRWSRSWSATGARSPRSSSSRSSSTSASCRRCPASWSASASWPPRTAPCSSSTRSRPASSSPTAARTSSSASSPTCSAWPRASAAACRSARSAARGEIMGVIEQPARAHRGRRRRTGARALDHPRWRDPRRAPGHVQRQPAGDGRRRGRADQDPDARRLSQAARHGRPTHRRQPGRSSTSSACPATRSTSGPKAA